MDNREKQAIATLILCGGKSSRMGKDKALLEFAGVPLLRKMVLLAQTLTPEVYLLTPYRQAYQSILPQSCHFLEEAHPHNGPLVAFRQGLEQIESTWIFLLACDLPLLTVETVKNWRNQLDISPPEILALVPFVEGYWHPLCGFYNQGCLPQLQSFLDQGGRSFQGWLDTSWVQPLAVENPEVLFNYNSPLGN